MASQLKSFPANTKPASVQVAYLGRHSKAQAATRASWFPIALTFTAVLAAVWSPDGIVKVLWMSLAAVCVIGFTFAGDYTFEELGLARPLADSTVRILGAGALMALLVATIAAFTPHLGPPRALPVRGLWLYAIWALLQQFLLQSFFYVRLEGLVGRRRALPISATMFAAAHVPNPILTPATLIGALFFTGMFRRYRTIYALAAVHTLLGLTIAATFSDHFLHHMRVGIGYITFHP
jgi:CAAX prenyl protease-like protein